MRWGSRRRKKIKKRGKKKSPMFAYSFGRVARSSVFPVPPGPETKVNAPGPTIFSNAATCSSESGRFPSRVTSYSLDSSLTDRFRSHEQAASTWDAARARHHSHSSIL